MADAYMSLLYGFAAIIAVFSLIRGITVIIKVVKEWRRK